MDEAKKIPDMSIEDAVKTLVSSLPHAVQQFVIGPDRDKVAIALAQKYQLHADQAGTFQQAYLHLLLGITTPEKFMNALLAAGITEENATALAQDLNDQVFKPLREKVIVPSEPAAETSVVKPNVNQPPINRIPTPVPPAISTPPPSIPPPKISPPSIPVSSPSVPPVRTMASDMDAVHEHRDPTPIPFRPQVTAPPLPPPPPLPKPIPQPTPSLPVAPPTPPQRIVPPPPNLPGIPPLTKNYGVDPYREPVE